MRGRRGARSLWITAILSSATISDQPGCSASSERFIENRADIILFQERPGENTAAGMCPLCPATARRNLVLIPEMQGPGSLFAETKRSAALLVKLQCKKISRQCYAGAIDLT